mmetsp:Transcript_30598/g.62004  ORF Transcript_30598/g.62004 Transcript_30598/m.62004 type:complete len:213 (-) Transcript_30598:329-967(-)
MMRQIRLHRLAAAVPKTSSGHCSVLCRCYYRQSSCTRRRQLLGRSDFHVAYHLCRYRQTLLMKPCPHGDAYRYGDPCSATNQACSHGCCFCLCSLYRRRPNYQTDQIPDFSSVREDCRSDQLRHWDPSHRSSGSGRIPSCGELCCLRDEGWCSLDTQLVSFASFRQSTNISRVCISIDCIPAPSLYILEPVVSQFILLLCFSPLLISVSVFL